MGHLLMVLASGCTNTAGDEFSPIAAYGGLGVGAVALAVALVALLRGNKL